MTDIFNTFLVQPFFNALIYIYNFLPWADIGIATIILTFVIRIILFPLFHKSTKQQILMTKIQPELAKLQKEYKDNKEKLVKAQMELYKKYGASPFGGCLITLIQLPILLAVYRVFLNGFSAERLETLYSFVSKPEIINTFFLGIFNLSEPNIWIAILSAGLQFISSKLIVLPTTKQKKDSQDSLVQKISGSLQKNMGLIAPVITFVILIRLPSILGIYWSATTLFSIIQQWIIQKKLKEEKSVEIIEKKEKIS
jgi:YidC/Oxa1 family membrane protein insertase